MGKIDQSKVDRAFQEAKRDAEAGATRRESKVGFLNQLFEPTQTQAEEAASKRGFEIGRENQKKGGDK